MLLSTEQLKEIQYHLLAVRADEFHVKDLYKHIEFINKALLQAIEVTQLRLEGDYIVDWRGIGIGLKDHYDELKHILRTLPD